MLRRPPQILDVNSEIRDRRGESINIEISADADNVTWSYDDQIAEKIEPGRFNFSITQVNRGGPITIFGYKWGPIINQTGSISAKTFLKVIDSGEVCSLEDLCFFKVWSKLGRVGAGPLEIQCEKLNLPDYVLKRLF